MKTKQPSETSLFQKWGLPIGDQAARGLFALTVLLIVALGTRLLWRKYGAEILARRGNAIQAESITIPPLPPWIRADIRADVVRQGSLDRLPLDQEDLTLRIAQAFRLNSWVANVRRVCKEYGNHVVVDLDYRRPVAMVEVAGPALFPVDANGVLLSPEDFRPEAKPVVKLTDFPWIRAEGTRPQGSPGMAWGDSRIHKGARVAACLLPVWERMKLQVIIAHRGPQRPNQPEKPEFELRTRNNTIIFWGRAPGDEEASESHAEKKVALLADFVQRNGSLDAVKPDQTIDVRHIDGLDVATLGRRLE